jgi:predicted HTH transcriptional regulator
MTPVQRAAALVGRPEDRTLEYKAAVPPPPELAKLIASFANAGGGTIIFGVREPGYRLVNIDEPRLARAVQDATARLDSPVTARLSIEEHSGARLGVLEVDKAFAPVSVDGVYLTRVGERTTPMTADDLKLSLVQGNSQQASIDQLAQSVARQSEIIERVRADLERANSPVRKLAIAGAGATAGVLGKWLGSLLLEFLRSAI